MDILYREMRIEDINQVMDLFKELNEEAAEVSFAEVESKIEIKAWLENEDYHVYVAMSKDIVLGVFRAIRGKEDKRHSCFLTAAVNKKYRGYKIAQSLTNFGLSKLKEQGVSVARAYIYSNNPASVSTILRCGFTASGCVHMHHYDEKTKNYVDDLIFHKIL